MNTINSENLLEEKHCYATSRKDVEKILTKIQNPFRIRLKPVVKLQLQGPKKIRLQYCNKLNNLLDDLQKNGLLKQTGSTFHQNQVMEFFSESFENYKKE